MLTFTPITLVESRWQCQSLALVVLVYKHLLHAAARVYLARVRNTYYHSIVAFIYSHFFLDLFLLYYNIVDVK